MTRQDGTADSNDERQRLRQVLGFPAAVETIDTMPARASAPSPEATAASERAPVAEQLEELTAKIARLSARTDVSSSLLDEVLERLDPAHQPPILTAEEVADIAARMVRVIETRLETHCAQLHAEIAELRAAIAQNDTPNLQRVQ